MQLPKFLQSAFDRLGNDQESMKSISKNTEVTATSVSKGGDLYNRIDDLVKAIEKMESGIGGTTNIKEALALRIVTPALKPIGLGLGFIVDALNRAPEGKELGKKMDALVGGLAKLGEVGKSILAFAGYIILAIPFLVIAALTMPIWAPAVYGIVRALMWAAEPLDKKAMKKMERLGEVGINLLVLGVSLALLSLMAIPILKGTVVAAGMILAVAGIFYLLKEMGIAESMEETGKSLIFAAAGILSVAVSLVLASFLLSAIGFEQVFTTLAVVLGVAGAFWLIGKMSKNMDKGAIGLMLAAGAIIAVGLAILFMKYVLGPLSPEDVLQSFVVLLVIGGIAATFWLIGTQAMNIVKGALAMIAVSFSLFFLSLGIKMIANAVPNLKTSLGIIALIAGLGVTFALIGAYEAGMMTGVPLTITLGSIAMLAVGASLLVLAAGISVIGGVVSEMTLEQAGMIALIIGGLAVGFAAAGFASPMILLGSAAMLVAGAATLGVGLGLLAISKLDFKALGTINEKGSKPFNWSGQETSGFFGLGARKKTNFEVAMDAIADGMSLGPLSVAAIALGAPTLIMAGAALVGVVAGIKAFTGIAKEADLPGLSENVRYIVSGLADTFAEVGTKYPGGGSSLLSMLTGSTKGQSVVAQGISAVGGMGRALTGIAKGVQAMADLKFPTGFDKEGNPTGYETINLTKAVPALTANTRELVTGLSATFAEVGESKAAQGSSWFTSSTYEKGVKVVKQMGEPLANLAKGVQAMANLKFPTEYDKDGNPTKYESIGNISALITKLSSNTKAIIIGLAGVFEEVGKSDAADTGWFSKNNFEKGIMVTQMLAEPYSSLAETVDNVVAITGKITDAEGVRDKVTAMIEAVTNAGDTDTALVNAKNQFIGTLGTTYEKIGTAVPLIIDAIARFTVDKAKAFASIFGGESPAELFEQKSKFMLSLTGSYLRMAVAIPLIVGSINTVQAEQLSAFSTIYGGPMTEVEEGTLNTRGRLFVAVGDAYEQIGNASGQITNAINAVDSDKLVEYKGLFVGRVSKLRPIAGYEAQTELWNAIGENSMTMSSSMPSVTEAINSMDMAKLVESRKMFEALGVLSNGGSASDILEKMGESLEDALNNLVEMLEQFKTAVGESVEGNQSVVEGVASTVGGAVGAFRDAVTGGRSQKEVVAAISKLKTALTSSGIKVKELPPASPLDSLNQ